MLLLYNNSKCLYLPLSLSLSLKNRYFVRKKEGGSDEEIVDC